MGPPQSASYFRPRNFEDYTRYFECVASFVCVNRARCGLLALLIVVVGILDFLSNRQQCMEGYLEKQSSEDPNLWKGRWFVMKDSKLFYYKKEADVREKVFSDTTVCGVIQLADIDSVTTAVRGCSVREFTFRCLMDSHDRFVLPMQKDFGVATFQIRTQSRRYILRAESKDRVHS